MTKIIERYANGKGVVNTEKWRPDPENKGYLKYSGQFTVKEVYDAIVKLLPEYGIEIERLEYFSCCSEYNYENSNREFPRSRWIACYVVTGDSEGHYIHVDSIDEEGKRKMVFLGKSLVGRDYAEKFCNAVSRILDA